MTVQQPVIYPFKLPARQVCLTGVFNTTLMRTYEIYLVDDFSYGINIFYSALY